MKLTKAEIKALLARCEQHTGAKKSKALESAINKLQAESTSKTTTNTAFAQWPVHTDLTRR